jgi:hypothetical protein
VPGRLKLVLAGSRGPSWLLLYLRTTKISTKKRSKRQMIFERAAGEYSLLSAGQSF